MNFDKILQEKYFLLKGIAKKYDYSEELLQMLTYIYISLYMDLGKKCEPALYDIFSNIKIIYEKGTVQEIAYKYGLGNIGSGGVAITWFKPNFDNLKNETLQLNPPIIILGTNIGDYLATPIMRLEMLTHEIRHAVMGYYKNNLMLDENIYYMRSGVKETIITRKKELKNEFDKNEIATALDEATNTYITTLLMNRIMNYKKYDIKDTSLKNYLYSLKTSQKNQKYYSKGYIFELKLLAPLLLNKMFIDLLNEHEFDGELEIIKDFINQNTSLCDYQEFNILLDIIGRDNIRYNKEMNNPDMDFVQSHIANIEKAKKIILEIHTNITR